MKKINLNKKAVTEIVGTILLLGMAIALFTIVQLMALNFPFSEPDPSARLTATIDNDTVVIIHQGGESLSRDNELIFTIDGGTPVIKTVDSILDSKTSDGNDVWNIGEKLLYNTSTSLSGKEVRITLIDIASNSVIMQGTVIGDDQK